MEILIRRLQQKEAEIANYLTIIEGQRQNIEWMQKELMKLDPDRFPKDETQFILKDALKEDINQCTKNEKNQKKENANDGKS